MSDIPERGYGTWAQWRRRYKKRGEAEFYVDGLDNEETEKLDTEWGTRHFADYGWTAIATTVEQATKDTAHG